MLAGFDAGLPMDTGFPKWIIGAIDQSYGYEYARLFISSDHGQQQSQ